MTEISLTMKLVIDNKNNRVLFAEADKDCVDFLFHMLSLPMATVIRLLKEDGMVGSVGNLHESIENLNESCVLPAHSKDSLLKPNCRDCACSVPVLQLEAPTVKNFYKCGYCSTTRVIADNPNSTCTGCYRTMNTNVTYVASPVPSDPTNESGFVKGLVTYIVKDDLVVMPMSTVSCIDLLNEFNVKDVSVLREKLITLSMNDAVKLLKASLYSKKVLTEAFLTIKDEKKPPINSVFKDDVI